MTEGQQKLAEAVLFLMQYEGKFDFLLDMKERVKNPRYQLTEKQVQAVLNCKKKREARPEKMHPDVEVGVYKVPRLGEDFDIIKVQLTQDKLRRYAKKLVPINGWRRNEEGEKVKWKWVYEPGLILKVKPEYRMNEEDARQFGLKYAICARCGRGLSQADSVDRGIGPVCIKYFRF